MKSYLPLICFVVVVFSTFAFAAPNFTLVREGDSLLVHFKQRELADRVIAELRRWDTWPCTAIVVISETGTFVQFFEFFLRGGIHTRFPRNIFQSDAYRAVLENLLEENIIGQATERFIRVIPRIPYAPTQEEIEARRAAHVANAVRMFRRPADFNPADAFELVREHVEIPFMMAQQIAVQNGLRRGGDPTREEIDAIVENLNHIARTRDEHVQAQRTNAVQAVLGALGVTFCAPNH
jgi:hypothetical protein